MLGRIHRGAGVALAVGAIAVGAPAAVVFAESIGRSWTAVQRSQRKFREPRATLPRPRTSITETMEDGLAGICQETSRRPRRAGRSRTPPWELYIPCAADLGRRSAPVGPRMVCQQPSRLRAGQAGGWWRGVLAGADADPVRLVPRHDRPSHRRQPAHDRHLLRRRVQPCRPTRGDDLVPRPAHRR